MMRTGFLVNLITGASTCFAMLASFVFGILIAKKFYYSKTRAAMLLALSIPLLFSATLSIDRIVDGGTTRKLLTLLVPFIAIAAATLYIEMRIFRIPLRKLMDYYSFIPPLDYAIAHMQCMYVRCCHGYSYDEGTFMYKIAYGITRTNVFPSVLCECLGTWICFIVLYQYLKRRNFNAGGRGCFVMCIGYGLVRFCMEFISDSEKIVVFKEMAGAHSLNDSRAVWGLGSVSFFGIILICIGIAGLILLHQIEKKEARQEPLWINRLIQRFGF